MISLPHGDSPNFFVLSGLRTMPFTVIDRLAHPNLGLHPQVLPHRVLHHLRRVSIHPPLRHHQRPHRAS